MALQKKNNLLRRTLFVCVFCHRLFIAVWLDLKAFAAGLHLHDGDVPGCTVPLRSGRWICRARTGYQKRAHGRGLNPPLGNSRTRTESRAVRKSFHQTVSVVGGVSRQASGTRSRDACCAFRHVQQSDAAGVSCARRAWRSDLDRALFKRGGHHAADGSKVVVSWAQKQEGRNFLPPAG